MLYLRPTQFELPVLLQTLSKQINFQLLLQNHPPTLIDTTLCITNAVLTLQTLGSTSPSLYTCTSKTHSLYFLALPSLSTPTPVKLPKRPYHPTQPRHFNAPLNETPPKPLDDAFYAFVLLVCVVAN